MLGSERVWVVHGADGLDEISTTGYTKVSEGHDGTVRTFHVHPGDFGLKKTTLASIAGGDARTNAKILVEMLGGQPGPVRDIVLLNAGAGPLRGRPRRVGARGHRPGRRRHRQRPRARRPRSAGAGHHRGAARMSEATSDLLGAIVAATRTRVFHAARRVPAGRPRAPDRPVAGAARVPCGAGAAWPARDRRVQAPLSEPRGLARRVRPGRNRPPLRRGRRGRDFRADRADVLRRVARASRSGPRGGRRADPSQGLRRRPVSTARGARVGRRCGAPHRRRARR